MGENLTSEDEFLGSTAVNFDPAGDVELWTVSDSGWCLPLLCTPSTCRENGSPYFLIRPALVPSAKGGRKVDRILRPLSVIGAVTYYALRDADVRRICVKAQGITPEYCLKVPPGEEIETVENVFAGASTHEEAINKDTAALSAFLAARCQVVRVGVIRTVLKALGDNVTEWLVVKGCRLDLGSIAVTALPYRKHWKETLAGFYGMAWLSKLSNDSGAEIRQRMNQLNILEDFAGNELIAMHPSAGTVRWTLEVEQRKGFWNDVDEHEKGILSKLGKEKYSKLWSSRIKERMDEALVFLLDWLNQASEPGCIAHKSLDGSRCVFVAKGQTATRLKDLARHAVVARSITPSGSTKKRLLSAPKPVEEADAGVPPVPALSPPPPDVREGG